MFCGSGIKSCLAGWFWLGRSLEFAVKTLTRATTIRRHDWVWKIHFQDGFLIQLFTKVSLSWGPCHRAAQVFLGHGSCLPPRQVVQETGGRFDDLVLEITRRHFHHSQFIRSKWLSTATLMEGGIRPHLLKDGSTQEFMDIF